MKQYNFDFSKKIFYHPEKITEYMQGKRPFPITVEIDLTNVCNHRCSFCNFSEFIKKDNSVLDTKIIKKRIAELRKLGSKGICFTGGGEAMTHKDFIEILQETKNYGFDIGLITNGSLINEEKAPMLVKNLQWIRISMGGGNRGSYSSIQGVDDFDRVIRNLKLLSETKEREKSYFNIGIRVLVIKENISSLVNLTSIIKNLKINYLQLAPDQCTDDEGLFWNSKKTRIVFDKIERILEENDIMLLTSGFSIGQERSDFPRTCYAHFFQIAITAEGKVMFCKNGRGNEARKDEKYVLGNINKNTLTEIWNGKNVKEIESWIKPSNCGLFCKNTSLNNALEESLHPTEDMSPNFVN